MFELVCALCIEHAVSARSVFDNEFETRNRCKEWLNSGSLLFDAGDWDICAHAYTSSIGQQ